MDDAEVDPRRPRGIQVVHLHRHLGRDVEVEPPRLGDEGDRADRLRGIRKFPSEAHPQLGGTLGHTEADPGALHGEASEAEADRHEAPLAPGEPGPHPLLLALGSLEEGGGVVLQDRLGTLPG